MRRAVLQAEAGTRAGHVTGVQTCALPILQAQSWAISSDIVPDSHAARFGGIMNFGGYFGGALAPIVTGAVVDAKIGRASCREGAQRAGGARALKERGADVARARRMH